MGEREVKSEAVKIKKLKDLCNNPNYWDEMFSSNGKLSKELIRSKNVILIHIDHILEFGKDCNEKGKGEARREKLKEVLKVKTRIKKRIEYWEDRRSKIVGKVLRSVLLDIEELEKELKKGA